jgi:outer membrane lipoprotein carrier protein
VRRLVVVVSGVLVACGVTAAVGVASEAIDSLRGPDKLDALIAEVVQRQRDLQSLRADFKQFKTSDMLLEPLESRGEFEFVAPDRVRWDYASPDPMIVVFADDILTTYHPEQRRAERIKVADRHQRLVRALAGTQPLDELASQFAIALEDRGAPAPYRLTLTPTHRALKKRLQEVVIDVDRQLLLPVTVEYRGAEGDVTRYEFRDLQLDPAIELSRFQLDLGADVEIETIDASG